MIFVCLCTLVVGLVVGFVWGLDIALRRPGYARGFLKGYNAPWEWIMKKIQIGNEEEDEKWNLKR